ncbi:putative conserved coiled coil protein (plasmid) [Octadecabacter antarcticus 307]|uniref:Putative conserved coiled coil protein n=1 Tax=Octadecabacter antarcticus 307 TaxID=391626 RepID=M9RK63_9RHOB|nr:hypothetical protein [Octadecabacter antarcticus]AGI70225.1 putative conserved coiled coil protein [Octadecabacter antarcticus 307]
MGALWRSARYYEGDRKLNTSETQFELFESQLAEWKVQVVKLEAKAAGADDEAKPAYVREVNELKAKFSKTEKQYNEARKAQKGTLPDTMDGLSSAGRDLGHAVGKPIRRFG